jgi:hypothetical protein
LLRDNSVIEIFNYYLDYENSFAFFINSLKYGSKFPIILSQFSKDIIFKFDKLQYLNKGIYVDPNINQALHHMLFNMRADYILNILPDYKKNFANVGFLNNLVFSYIATSKFSTSFFDTSLMKYNPLENSLIADKKLLGYVGAQYLSRLILVMENVDWTLLNDAAKTATLIAKEEEVFIGMLKNLDVDANDFVKLNCLPQSLNTLENVISVYKSIFEAQYQMSVGYKQQFDNISFKAGYLHPNDICQILYNFNLNTDEIGWLHIKMDGLVLNSETLKNIYLKDYSSLSEFIKCLKNKKFDKELIDLDIQNISKTDVFFKKI